MWAHKMPCQVTDSCKDDSLDLFGALITLFSFAHTVVMISVADPDRESGAFLTPGSGMGKKSGSGSGIRIRDEQPESYFREPRNHFLG
jgi:hypothetical protein